MVKFDQVRKVVATHYYNQTLYWHDEQVEGPVQPELDEKVTQILKTRNLTELVDLVDSWMHMSGELYVLNCLVDH